jgi:hypothetical protein
LSDVYPELSDTLSFPKYLIEKELHPTTWSTTYRADIIWNSYMLFSEINPA